MMTFDEIVESIPFEKFKTYFLMGQYEILKRWVPSERRNKWIKGIEEELGEEKQPRRWNQDSLVNIAYFAKAIAQMHPGWIEWKKR